jgi:uncharacterized protein (DUF1499 family)
MTVFAWQLVGIGAALVLLLPVLVLALLRVLARRPSNLGVRDGRLADCPATPNCVSTFARDGAQHMAALCFAGTAAEALRRLQDILAAMPRARTVTATDRYLHVEFTSHVFRFVDDVEFLIDPENRQVHFRSASRVGRSDLGVNRRRMEAIRRQFEAE